MDTRVCCHCHEEKPLMAEFFYREKRDGKGFGRRCKACNNARVAAWYAAHPEVKLARSRAYVALHREEAVVRAVAWKRAHPDKVYEHSAKWRKANPDKCLAMQHRRRARLNNAEKNDFTAAQWQEMKAAYANRCAYCHRKMKRLEQDHITPIARGGSNTVMNIVPACRSCNRRKSKGPPLKPAQPLLLTVA